VTAFRSRLYKAKCNSETLIVFHRVRLGHLNASESLSSFTLLCIVLIPLQLDVGERSAYNVALGVADAFSMSACVEGMVHQWLSEFVMQYWFSMYYSSRDI
jgi:hypothetical protein